MPSSSSTQAHARSHALLLLQKLLNLRDSASPLTLILDTLEQSGRPVLREFLTRGKIAKSKIIFISFSTIRKPSQADVFIRARGKSPEVLRQEIVSHYPSSGQTSKTLIIIDTLNPLSSSTTSSSTLPLPLFLSSLITSPSISLVAIYHLDVPCTSSSSSCHQTRTPGAKGVGVGVGGRVGIGRNEYEPSPLTLLLHLATAILRVSDPRQVLARKKARDRSVPEPEWGLQEEGKEGVLVGLKGGGGGEEEEYHHERRRSGISKTMTVLEMELRRRSGRSVVETFLLVPGAAASPPNSSSSSSTLQAGAGTMGGMMGKISLLSDHAAFQRPTINGDGDDGSHGEGGAGGAAAAAGQGEQPPESTFSLGLTDKERRDRDGIVLPYFDAQTDIGGGDGGRILYEMGREDDFDDEEDEI